MILRCASWTLRRNIQQSLWLPKFYLQTQCLLVQRIHYLYRLRAIVGRNSLHTIAAEGGKLGVEDSEVAAIRDRIWDVQNGGR